MDEKLQNRLFALPHVIGVGQGYKEVGGALTKDKAIVVLVKKKVPLDQLAEDHKIPPKIEGMLTDVIEVGEFKAHLSKTLVDLNPESDVLQDVSRMSRIRPALSGVSIGHFRVTAGTFGAVVYDKETGAPLILSNNHILANSSNGRDGRARIGDPILQPGPLDGGFSSNNVLGQLTRYMSLDEYPRMNEVDCALAKPLKDDLITPEILGLGKVLGVTLPKVGMSVIKSGRTTGVTSGQIRVLDVTTNVSYGQGRTLRFGHQILTTPLSEGGDSGSLVLDEHNYVVGLLFAGSNQGTLLNPIERVLELLKVQF